MVCLLGSGGITYVPNIIVVAAAACTLDLGSGSSSAVRSIRQLSPSVRPSARGFHLVAEEVGSSQPRPSVSVPIIKIIFISRLVFSTDSSDVADHITVLVGTAANRVEISKVALDRYASFKIFVPEEIFERWLRPENWPAGCLVKEFEQRKGRRWSSGIGVSNRRSTSK